MEKQAYLLGNMLFRDWEDNLKKQRNSSTMINEKVLRAKIRALISEMTDQGAFDIENKAIHKYDESCDCEQCSKSTRDALKMKGVRSQGYMAESTKKVLDAEKQTMPLNEWRNMELNSLLLNRFGIVSPQVLGEKKNKKPDADGDGVPDWADKEPNDPKVGAKSKKTPKKGKVPPQFLKKGKKDESK
jgi:hypothetical protein